MCVCVRVVGPLKIITFASGLTAEFQVIQWRDDENYPLSEFENSVCLESGPLPFATWARPICSTGFGSEWRHCLSTCEWLHISPERHALVWLRQDVFTSFFFDKKVTKDAFVKEF